MKKQLIGLALFIISVCAFAADIPLTPADFVIRASAKDISDVAIEGDTTIVTGWTLLASAKDYPYVEGKAYGLRGEFKGVADTPDNNFYFGFLPLDADKRVIDCNHATTVANTETKLLADVKPEDTFIMVEDASKWLKGSIRAVFNIKSDLSDLPNRNISTTCVKAIEKTENGWKVSFVSRVGRKAQAGELVREHRDGGYVYVAAGIRNSKGIVNASRTINKFYPGTKYLKVVILCNWTRVKEGPQPKLAIKNVSLTEN